MAVPYTFATASASIPLSQLDSNFATPITMGNTAVSLGDTIATLNNMTFVNAAFTGGIDALTLTNVTISSVAAAFPNAFLAHSTATLGNATVTLGATTSTVGGLRVQPRVTTLNGNTASPTLTILTDSSDSCDITTSVGISGTVTIDASGTPTTDQILRASLQTATSSFTLAFSAKFEAASTLALPTTMTTNRRDCTFIWNAATSKWRIIASVV